MTLAIWFWILYVLSLLFGLWTGYTPGQPYPFRTWGVLVVVFILIGFLGFRTFGGPIQ
jgi:hypothetical protein